MLLLKFIQPKYLKSLISNFSNYKAKPIALKKRSKDSNAYMPSSDYGFSKLYGSI